MGDPACYRRYCPDCDAQMTLLADECPECGTPVGNTDDE
jgi:predicted amidophosphoribosyltransferase